MMQLTRRPALPITAGVSQLVGDTSLCKKLDAVAPEIDLVLAQIQLDHVTPENRDNCGPTLLALQLVRDAFFLFTTKGRAVMKSEQSAEPPTTT
jgi:hypothetical protein